LNFFKSKDFKFHFHKIIFENLGIPIWRPKTGKSSIMYLIVEFFKIFSTSLKFRYLAENRLKSIGEQNSNLDLNFHFHEKPLKLSKLPKYSPIIIITLLTWTRFYDKKKFLKKVLFEKDSFLILNIDFFEKFYFQNSLKRKNLLSVKTALLGEICWKNFPAQINLAP